MYRFILGGCVAMLAANCWAGERCFVRAPSDGMAIVRMGPNDSQSNLSMNNGTQVSLWRVEKDRNGQRWAYVTPAGPGYTGYIFRDYLVCF
jgi:hypothetical protein